MAAMDAPSAPAQPKTITDGRHPHPLTLRRKPRSYTCDRCKCAGYGRRYRCNECKVSLHESCATCSDSINFFMHPDHTLTLQRSYNPVTRHTCEVCGERAHGYFYRCKPCSYELHPFCSLLTPTVTDEVHPGHTLRYVSSSSKDACAVCGEGCEGWRYCCDECGGFHVHMRCLRAAAMSVGSAGEDDGGEKKRKGIKKTLKVVAGFGVVLGVVLAALAGEGGGEFDFEFGGDEDEGDDDDDDDDDDEPEEEEDDDAEDEEEEEGEGGGGGEGEGEEESQQEERKKKNNLLKKLFKKNDKKKGK